MSVRSSTRQKQTDARRRTPSTRGFVARVLALSLIGSVVLFAFLAAQMSAGRDPALGPKADGARQSAERPRRRVVKTTVIVRRLAGGPSLGFAVPAPAPAPAPASVAPAPAPVTTSTS